MSAEKLSDGRGRSRIRRCSTDLKLSLVEGYLRAFTTALHGKFDQLWYIDAFAGTGERTVRHAARGGDLLDPPTEERIERHRGSAKIAIDVVPKFDRLIFMDKEPKYCAALRDLAQKNGDRHIAVIEGDANSAIKQIANEQKWDRTRAVMFLDPYGMSVDWGTLEAIKATAAIDVWYLVSLSGLFRQAARNASALDRSKRSALTRMLGTEAWQDAWYRRREGVKDLFGDIDEEHSRVADVQAMETFVLQRLRELFPRVLNPLKAQ